MARVHVLSPNCFDGKRHLKLPAHFCSFARNPQVDIGNYTLASIVAAYPGIREQLQGDLIVCGRFDDRLENLE